jgi:hypothetical protein
LGSLIKHKNYLKENKLFVALVTDEIQLLSWYFNNLNHVNES